MAFDNLYQNTVFKVKSTSDKKYQQDMLWLQLKNSGGFCWCYAYIGGNRMEVQSYEFEIVPNWPQNINLVW